MNEAVKAYITALINIYSRQLEDLRIENIMQFSPSIASYIKILENVITNLTDLLDFVEDLPSERGCSHEKGQEVAQTPQNNAL